MLYDMESCFNPRQVGLIRGIVALIHLVCFQRDQSEFLTLSVFLLQPVIIKEYRFLAFDVFQNIRKSYIISISYHKRKRLYFSSIPFQYLGGNEAQLAKPFLVA